MSSFFTLVLDTKAPANPSLLINAGAALTGTDVVQVTLSTSDYQAGARDVQQMKLWGDVDPAADAQVQIAEGAAGWQTFQENYPVKLSAGAGRKTIYAKLRDDVCNETPSFCDFIDLDTSLAVVRITTPVDRGRISKVPSCNEAIFGWQASIPFDAYQVRVVPNAGSPVVAGAPLGTLNGSTNVAGSGSFPANTTILTKVRGGDLEAASPGDTAKLVKVFVRDTTGDWSP